MVCKFCGTNIAEGALFCTNCGKTVASMQAESNAVDLTKKSNEPQPIDAYAQNNAYGQNNSSMQQSSYTAQGTGVQQNPYAPQGVGAQQNPYAPQGVGAQQNPYAPQGVGVQQNPYAPNGGYGQQGGYANGGYSNVNYGSYGQNSSSYYQQGSYNVPIVQTPDKSTPTLVLGIVSVACAVMFYLSFVTFVTGPIAIVRACLEKKREGKMRPKSKVGLGLAIGGLGTCLLYTIYIVFYIIVIFMQELD